jgi:phasin
MQANPAASEKLQGITQSRISTDFHNREQNAPQTSRRKIMAARDQFEMPADMRAFVERSVEQAKQAFDGFISAAHQAVNAFEGQAETARKGARQVTEKAMSFAEKNVANSFEFAQQLVQAKDVQEVLKLQADFIRGQMQVLAEQVRELGETAGKAATEATTPKR